MSGSASLADGPSRLLRECMPKKLSSWKPPRLKTKRPTKEHDHYNQADWRAKRTRIAIRDLYRCRDCGKVAMGKAGHCDHIKPLEEGGSDSDDNLAWRCDKCHGKKTRAEQRRRGII